MSKHEHDFGPGPPRFNHIVFCRIGDCAEARIGTKVTRSKRSQWRGLTVDEQLAVLDHQFKAVAIGQAMQIIHGKERGLARAREVLGYGP